MEKKETDFLVSDALFFKIVPVDKFQNKGTGTLFCYDENGNLIVEGYVVNYKLEDQVVGFYPDRSLKFIALYDSGQLMEINTFYSKTETIEKEGHYVYPLLKSKNDKM